MPIGAVGQLGHILSGLGPEDPGSKQPFLCSLTSLAKKRLTKRKRERDFLRKTSRMKTFDYEKVDESPDGSTYNHLV